MRNRRYHIILFMTLVQGLSYKAHAQQDSLVMYPEYLTVKNGLSQGLVSCVIQDKDGLMWFGTKDGLNKYDGYKFTTYRKQQDNPYSLPDNFITCMLEDDWGNLWIGTNTGGLCLFDKKNEKFYAVGLKKDDRSFSNNTISQVKYLNGKLMVVSGSLTNNNSSTADRNITIYEVRHVQPGNYRNIDLSKSTIYFDSRLSLPHRLAENNYTYRWMPNNSLWICYADSIMVFDQQEKNSFTKTITYATATTGMSANEEYCPVELPTQNQILFAGIHELVIYDFAKSRLIKKIVYNDDYSLAKHIEKIPDGNYYFSSRNHSYYFNSRNFTLIPLKADFGFASNTCIDRNGMIWAGTSGFGIIKYDPAKMLFRRIQPNFDLKFSFQRKGELLYRTKQGPFFMNMYNHTFTPLMPAGAWKNGRVIREFLNDGTGKNWITCVNPEETETYLVLYDEPSGRIIEKQLKDILLSNQIRLFTDRNEKLWMGTFDTKGNPILLRINSNNLETEALYTIPAKSQNFYAHFISAAWQDDKGIFWFASLQGLYNFDEKNNKWQHWQHDAANKTSLGDNQLLSILPDPKEPQKYLWMGTEGSGLDRFDISTEKFTHYTDKNGLPNQVVYGLLSDSNGNIWMSSNKGLSCLNPLNGAIRNFTIEDGLQGDEFNRYEFFKHPNGDLFFGGIDGGVIFNPSKVLQKESAPNIVFTGLSIYNKPVDYLSSPTILGQPITYAQTITLPHDKNMFSISFAALEYRDAGKKYYKYKLEGYDKQWIESGNKNEATYTNLPPGIYTFHVTGAGRSDNWNTKGAAIKIIILPAWYQTWWFKAVLAALITGLIYAFYRYRLKQVVRLQSIRNNIASDLHDEIGSTLSSISLSSAVIQKKLPTNSGEVGNLLQQISANTDDMMEAMSDIVWAVNTKNDNFESILNRMRAFAIQLLEPKDIRFQMNTSGLPKNIILDMRQRKNFYLIFKEAVHNCAKYAQCKNLRVDIEKNSDKIIMQITDDGCGFDFPGPNPESLGGNGLHNMQTRAKEMRGSLDITSQPGKGTVLTLSCRV